jgi:hypothetical protein
MVVLCKRCGRVLKAARSIKLGYGPTCYKKVNTQANPINLEEEIRFLKIEIKTLKKLLNELRVPQVISTEGSPIVRIKNELKDPVRDVKKDHMKEVLRELKNRFQGCNGDIKTLLTPIRNQTNMIETNHFALVESS